MAYTCFDLEIRDHVAHLRLNRPDKLNSMTREFWSEIPAALQELDAGAKARVVVLSSTGKHFSAGMALGVFTSGDGTAAASGAREVGRQREALRRSVLQLQDSLSA